MNIRKIAAISIAAVAAIGGGAYAFSLYQEGDIERPVVTMGENGDSLVAYQDEGTPILYNTGSHVFVRCPPGFEMKNEGMPATLYPEPGKRINFNDRYACYEKTK